MEKNSITEEIEICKSILAKFKEEMEDCKKDYETLKSLKETDGKTTDFKKASLAVKERHDDIALSVKLIKGRIEKLEEDLKSAK